MFLFNLCPFPVKQIGHLYTWMTIPAINRFRHEDIVFLGTEPQLADPRTVPFAPWVYGLVGHPGDVDWDGIRKIVVPGDVVARTVKSVASPLELLDAMIRTGFQEYREWLFNALVRMRKDIEAAVTFVNDASLDDVCQSLRIPVVHMEGGFMRHPAWRVSTFQFDFQGVNGNTEAARRFAAWDHRGDGNGRERIAELLLGPDQYAIYRTRDEDIRYEIGIPLQVEDDSNVISFSNGESNLSVLYKARQLFAKANILARNHPFGKMSLNQQQNLAMIDDSPSSVAFVARCKRILTINSSVAFEGLVMNRPTYILGDSALRPAAYTRLDQRLRNEYVPIERQSDYLEFIAFNYLIPFTLWMNPDYIRFRLGRPSEDEIRAVHLRAIEKETGRKPG